MTERSQLVVQRADGVGEPSVLTSGSLGRVSADGRWFAWREDEGGIGRLRYALLDGDSLGDTRTFVGTEKADVASFDLSPDGTLLAYAARDPSRQSNIYLMEFPSGAARWQVTTNGGTFPRFSADGRELLFMSGSRTTAGELEGRLMVMPLARQPSVRPGVAKLLLSGAAMPTGFTPARDGRLLVARPVPETAGRSRTVLIQNWPLLARTAVNQ
jgi:dipeptidyl aminopeptidase/acylaminoacyl peptidase